MDEVFRIEHGMVTFIEDDCNLFTGRIIDQGYPIDCFSALCIALSRYVLLCRVLQEADKKNDVNCPLKTVL
ncbi:hypothetical protein BFW38_09855 [Terasakiispira papahanaumokuakeensis]|uniref:Uncharacterized protein n=1 Tax=Terasakiispira papahanaumokuakeensis TaxID=197479 RepID=A0A1E2V9V2_9GAMM|nr:hypothetical protein BFW38_09855 [Terasakiispira papahanaumokuakeensis]